MKLPHSVIWMVSVFFVCLFSCANRSFKRIKITEMYGPLVVSNLGSPFACIFRPKNTGKTAIVSGLYFHVPKVLLFRNLPQIIYSIVLRVSVNVVNVAFRPSSVINKKSHSVRTVSFTHNSSVKISFCAHSAKSFFASKLSIKYVSKLLPRLNIFIFFFKNKFSCLRVIIQNFYGHFMSNHNVSPNFFIAVPIVHPTFVRCNHGML